jgi:hypothetical protein
MSEKETRLEYLVLTISFGVVLQKPGEVMG